jgi:putative AlgH/UPF0301 family transcriptional regulator
MSQTHLIVATQRTNATQHDLWRFAVILPFEVETGTMGFIMNQSVANIDHRQVSLLYNVGTLPRSRVWCGGPQLTERCTVLHSSDYSNPDTTTISDHAAITFNTQIIQDINQGHGPKHYKIMLGFCQWESGQLDAELVRGMWHQCDWNHIAWSSYKRKDKMWRRIIESESTVHAQQFIDRVWSESS